MHVCVCACAHKVPTKRLSDRLELQLTKLDFPIHNTGIQTIMESSDILHPFTLIVPPLLQFPLIPSPTRKHG